MIACSFLGIGQATRRRGGDIVLDMISISGLHVNDLKRVRRVADKNRREIKCLFKHKEKVCHKACGVQRVAVNV